MVDQEDPIPEPMAAEEEKSEIFEFESVQPRLITITDDELRSLKSELLDYKDKYLRLLADADNARKRLQKEREETTRYAVESVVTDFLRPLDNLENALRFAQQMSDEVRNWAFGFQMILTEFKDILQENGVVTFESKGHSFNPHLHEAIEVVESNLQPAGTVLEECVKGYKMGDRVIRPARVKVVKSLSETVESEETNNLN